MGIGIGGTGDQAGDALRGQARRHSRTLARFARAGFAAKGIVYLVIGSLAVMAAAGSGGDTTDARGALHVIGDRGPGRWLLALMGAGLVGFALWSVVVAALDAEDRGSDPKGWALRAGRAVRGLFYGALGLESLRIVLHRATTGGGGAAHWSARAMAMPWGRWLVVAGGLGVMAYALYQFWRGARKNLRKHLRLGGDEAAVGAWVMRLARFGIVARGLVFLFMGWFLVRAGMERDAGRVGGVDASLAAMAAQSYGPILLGVVAVGLIAYGLWELANARYREIPVT
jgi:hypothetical protein